MRHANKKKRIGRNASHRKATLQALSTALIRHKRIETTLAKAKALRPFVEPILHRAQDDSTASRRQAFRRLQDKEAVKTLFSDVADAIGDRPGGYTRIVKLGQRAGDAAEMAVIELVDFNDVQPEGTGGTKRKTRRSRRRSGGSSTGTTPKASAPATAPKAKAAEKASEADDLTKVWGIGPVFAEALVSEGIDTYAKLAEADIETLRGVINADTSTSDENANEETWPAQARLAEAGNWDGLDAFIEEQKAEGGTAHEPSDDFDAEEAAAESADETEAEAPAAEAPESQEAEAVASDAANPDATGNPQIPQGPNNPDHGDAEQGAAAGTGEPPPEAQAENQGRSADHR